MSAGEKPCGREGFSICDLEFAISRYRGSLVQSRNLIAACARALSRVVGINASQTFAVEGVEEPQVVYF
jgi:hypothetical protein